MTPPPPTHHIEPPPPRLPANADFLTTNRSVCHTCLTQRGASRPRDSKESADTCVALVWQTAWHFVVLKKTIILLLSTIPKVSSTVSKPKLVHSNLLLTQWHSKCWMCSSCLHDFRLHSSRLVIPWSSVEAGTREIHLLECLHWMFLCLLWWRSMLSNGLDRWWKTDGRYPLRLHRQTCSDYHERIHSLRHQLSCH